MFDLGAQVDEMYGTARMLVIYFVSSVFGFTASSLVTGAVSVGASAAVCGLIGAMIALGLRQRNSIGDALRGTYIRWFLFILLLGFVQPGIDNAAHIGGLASGFAVAYIAGEPGRAGSPTEFLWKVSVGLSVLITGLCFLMMYLSNTPVMAQ
jgi:rhomboid protease GluP